MVTPNVEDLSGEFEDIVEERDIIGAATVGLAGAAGGVIATQIAGRVAPLVGQSANPSDLPGLLVNGTIKMIVGAALALLAIRVGGTPGLVLGISGLGALVLGGGDWINAVLATDVGVPSSAPRASGRVRGNARARSVRSTSSSSSGGSSGSVSASNVSDETDATDMLA